MQTILGAGGTIGRDLAKELANYTASIRLVSRHPKKVNPGDELFPADLTDAAQVRKAVQGSEVVYLLVGFEYKLSVWRREWPRLMKAVIDACVESKAKLVFFDNVYLYDPGEIGHMTEQSRVNPSSEKGKVRAGVVEMLWEAVRKRGLEALVARAADFYGPGNEKSFLIEVVQKNFAKAKKANWFMDATKKHAFTYTPDAARATALLGNTPDAYGQTWHLPTAPAMTGKQWILMFATAMGVEAKYSVLPMWLLRALGLFMPLMREMPEMMYQYDRDYVFDSSKFTARFPFQVTPPAVGIKATVDAGIRN
jgi:nucleoside-diphosphate-sugar epimerase